MRYATAAALAVLATACGGGGDAKPEASQTQTPAPTQSTVVVTPEAKAVRDAVAKTLAACPCEVTIRAGSSETGHMMSMTGVYDPKTQTSELRELENGKPTGAIVRIVEGRAFLNAGTPQWLELDFSGLPKKPVSVLVPLAVADPRLSFAAASNVTVATDSGGSGGRTMYDVELDMATTRNAAGPWADLMKRLVSEASIYEKLFVKDGLLQSVSWSASGSPTDDTDGLSVTMTVTRTGAAAPNVTAPNAARKVDVATFTG